MQHNSNSTLHRDTLILPRQDMVVDINMVPFSSAELCYEPVKDISITDDYLQQRFGSHDRHFMPTYSGTQAVTQTLKLLNLNRDDHITILTTTGNFYISGCVTKAIEKVCSWSREINEKTTVIYVNHEFGFPYPELEALTQYQLPIIEDCAYSFASFDKQNSIGTIGDYCIYSFPKFFPVQFGGLLTAKSNRTLAPILSEQLHHFLYQQLARYLPQINSIITQRRENFLVYQKIFSQNPKMKTDHFILEENICPGAFFFSYPKLNYRALKIFLSEHGIESSVFYGQDCYFLPVHHKLTQHHLSYIFAVIDFFIEHLLNNEDFACQQSKYTADLA